jgi:hypothetical protein
MNRVWRRLHSDERGSIMLALLAIVILTAVATVGLATVVEGQSQTRHDTAFAQSLNNSESGLDSMVDQIKSHPANANAPELINTGKYDATAVVTSVVKDGTGAITNRTWLIDSKGTATSQHHTVTREVQEQISLSNAYTVPLYGINSLGLGQGSGVEIYDPGTTGGSFTQVGTGLLGLLSTSILEYNGTPGAAATDGPLSVSSNDLSQFSQIGRENLTASCGDATSCGSTTVVNSSNPPAVLPTPCQAGIGTDLDINALTNGTQGLNVDAIYNILPGFTFNATLNTDLANLGDTGITLCDSVIPLVIPSLAANLGPLGTLTVPINSVCSTVNLTLAQDCTMRDPQTLQFFDTGAAPIQLGTGGPTVISGVIYAPGANCTISGNVILYGALICGNITSTPGSSIDVEYDDQLNYNITERTVTVTNWNEVH